LLVVQEATHARFWRLLNELLCGQLDNTRFEDECRLALGAGSFALFTLDKNVQQLLKQVELLGADQGRAAASLALYAREHARVHSVVTSTSPQPADRLDAALALLTKNYEAAACRLMADHSSGCVVRIEFVCSTL
jgi:hypothetical protein